MKHLIVLTATLLFGLGVTADLAARDKIRTMIVTGQDGSHWWQGGSDAIKQILEHSGLFTVDIHVTPAADQDIYTYAPDFTKYQLVVFNYGGKTFSEATRRSFEKYMQSGGGMVVVHSSVVPMDDWKEYNEMIGLGAWNGRNEQAGPYVYWKNRQFVYDYSPGWAGYHGLQHPFTITHRRPDHPILKGLPVVWDHYKDELYARLRGPAKGMEILATTYEPANNTDQRHDPMLWTVRYGQGKVFVTLMGHAGNDPELRYSMTCTGFQVTLLRGAEWAATGNVTQQVPADFPGEGIITQRRDFKAPFHANP